MDGKTHLVAGSIVGGLVSLGVGNDLVGVDTGVLIVAGGIAGLVPDLDTNGKLANKLTISYQVIKNLLLVVGYIMLAYSLFSFTGKELIYGVLVAFATMMLSKYVTQRRMLLVTGVMVVVYGFTIGILWLVLAGIYVTIASFLSHRTYTHSLIGLIYFGIIAYYVSVDFSSINGLFLTLVLGYVSHLVLDFKVFNKRGVKLFRPFLDVEI